LAQLIDFLLRFLQPLLELFDVVLVLLRLAR
jgi:hypothetical protein